MNNKISIVGAGKMGSAIYRSLREEIAAEDLYVTDVYLPALEALGAKNYSQDAAEMLAPAGIVIVAVKPQDFAQLVEALTVDLSDKLVISIMAGVSSERIASLTGAKRVVRAMPNLALDAGAAVTGWIASAEVTTDERAWAQGLFARFGVEIELAAESAINTITALSGSGPAYFFLLSELLAAQAVELGFEPAVAQKLAKQVLIGSAAVLGGSTQTAAELKAAVASKGGTTEAALAYFESKQLAEIVAGAIRAAQTRAAELNS